MDLVDAAAFAAATRSPAALDALARPSGGAIVVDARAGAPGPRRPRAGGSGDPGDGPGSGLAGIDPGDGPGRGLAGIDPGALDALPAVVVALTDGAGDVGARPPRPGSPGGVGRPGVAGRPEAAEGQPAAHGGDGGDEGGTGLRPPPGEPPLGLRIGGAPGPVDGDRGPARAAPGVEGWAWADVVVGDPGEAERVVAAVEANPRAATALALHLRASATLGVDAALVAESATYSLLQAGPEHRRWLAGRPAPPGSRGTGTQGAQGKRDDRGDERVRVTAGRGTLHVTLTRPAVRNAVDAAMQRALTDALLVAAADPDVRVVLDGAGPTFSAGGDLGEFGTLADPATAHLLRLARSPGRVLARLADRTTAVVHGACHGAGVELPAFAGRVVARPGTTFTLPEVAMGLVPGAGGTVSLPRRIGRQRTAWLALTGHPLDAATALAWGLVDAVVEPA